MGTVISARYQTPVWQRTNPRNSVSSFTSKGRTGAPAALHRAIRAPRNTASAPAMPPCRVAPGWRADSTKQYKGTGLLSVAKLARDSQQLASR